MAWAKSLPTVIRLYICAVAWAIRNPAYGYDNWAGVTIKQPYQLTIEGNEQANISRDEDGTVHCTEGTYRKTLVNGDGKEYFEFCKVWHGEKTCNRMQFGWHLHTPEAGGRRNLKFTFNRW